MLEFGTSVECGDEGEALSAELEMSDFLGEGAVQKMSVKKQAEEGGIIEDTMQF